MVEDEEVGNKKEENEDTSIEYKEVVAEQKVVADEDVKDVIAEIDVAAEVKLFYDDDVFIR